MRKQCNKSEFVIWYYGKAWRYLIQYDVLNIFYWVAWCDLMLQGDASFCGNKPEKIRKESGKSHARYALA
jgi:hypothetical protein